MKTNFAQVFFLATQLLLIAAFGCLIVSLTTTFWLKSLTTSVLSTHFGLFTYCQAGESGMCRTRTNVLRFKKEKRPVHPLTSYDLDLMLISLIVSLAFIAIAFSISLLVCCVTKIRQKCFILTCLVGTAIIALVSCLFAIVHFENLYGDAMIKRAYSHGWSSLIAWVGLCILVVDTFLLVLFACAKPCDKSNKGHSVSVGYTSTRHTTSTTTNETVMVFTNLANIDAFYVGKARTAEASRKMKSSPRIDDLSIGSSEHRSKDLDSTPVQWGHEEESKYQICVSSTSGNTSSSSDQKSTQSFDSSSSSNVVINNYVREGKENNFCKGSPTHIPGRCGTAHDSRTGPNEMTSSVRQISSPEMKDFSCKSCLGYYTQISESMRVCDLNENDPMSQYCRSKLKQADNDEENSRTRMVDESNHQLQTQEKSDQMSTFV